MSSLAAGQFQVVRQNPLMKCNLELITTGHLCEIEWEKEEREERKTDLSSTPLSLLLSPLQLATSSTSLCWGYSFSYVDGAETETGTDRLADGQRYSGTHDSSVGIGNSWHWAFNASARFQFNLHKAGKWAGRAEEGRVNGVCGVTGGRERQGSLSVGACRNLSRRT